MEQEKYSPHGDRAEWEYHNRPQKHFMFEGWLNNANGVVDGHLPAEDETEARAILNRLGDFKWIGLRFICTKFNPWNKNISTMAIHQGEWIGESYDGDVDHYKCRNCGQEYSIGH